MRRSIVNKADVEKESEGKVGSKSIAIMLSLLYGVVQHGNAENGDSVR